MLSPADDYTPLSLKRGEGPKSIFKLLFLPPWVDQERFARKWRFQHCPLHKRVLEGKGGEGEEGKRKRTRFEVLLVNAKGPLPQMKQSLKEIKITTCHFQNSVNQIPSDHTVEVRNRFKGLDLIDRVPDELWNEVRVSAF